MEGKKRNRVEHISKKSKLISVIFLVLDLKKKKPVKISAINARNTGLAHLIFTQS